MMFTMNRTFAGRLRELLDERGMTPYALARDAKLARSNVSAYLAGRTFPGDEAIKAIARELKCEEDELRTLVRLSQIGPDWDEKIRRYMPEVFIAGPHTPPLEVKAAPKPISLPVVKVPKAKWPPAHKGTIPAGPPAEPGAPDGEDA